MARGLNIFVNIGAKVASSVNASASSVEKRFAAMGRAVKLAGATARADLVATERQFGKMGRNFQNFAYQASLPMAGLVVMGGKTAYEFEKIGNELQGISEMSDKARKKIEDVARAMPGRSTFNLGAATDLARTGFTAEAIEGSLPTVVKLAQSERGMDTEKAADIASNVMVGMRLFNDSMDAKTAGAQFAKVADRIAFGAAKSSSDIRLMGDSFKYAGPLASRLGMDMDQLAAAFMVMADAGIKGSESGIAVRSMMVRMLKPTKSGQAMLNRLGIDMKDFVTISRKTSGSDVVKTLQAQGINASGQTSAIDKALASGLDGAALTEKITSIVSQGVGGAMDADKISDGVANALLAGADKADMFGLINKLMEKGATTADILQFVDTRQGARLATLFDKDKDGKSALDKKLALVKQGAPGFLQRQYSQATKGIVGSFLRLQSSFDNLLITMARTGVIDNIASVFEKLAKGMDSMSKTNPGLLKFLTYAAIGIAVLGPLGMLLGGISSGFMFLAGILRFAAPWILRAGLALVRFPLFALDKILSLFLRVGPLGGMIARTWAPALFRGLLSLAPILLRGLGLAFGVLSGPVGWAILAVSAAMLIWKYREQIAKGWHAITTWFTTVAWPAVRDTIASIDWAAIGMAIADKLTFGLASRLPAMGAAVKNALSNTNVNIAPVPFGATPPQAGARAGGGNVSRFGSYRVNEEGQELFAPGMSGTVIPARATAALMAAANGNAPGAANGNLTVGDIHIHGANDPASTRRIVREELQRIASAQRGGLHD